MCLVMKTRRVLVTIIILMKRVLIRKLLITVLLQVERVGIVLVQVFAIVIYYLDSSKEDLVE